MADRDTDVHDRAMRAFDAIWSVEKHQRALSLVCRRFATIRGAQWEGQFAYGDQATTDAEMQVNLGLPRMEINLIQPAAQRAFSDYRANRITVDFRPRGQASDAQSADALDGLYRADENDTRGGGQAAYDVAHDEARLGGFGAWAVEPRWEDEGDEENERQRIGILPIYDADQSVFFDLDAKHQDKSDARHCFVLRSLSRAAFEAAYPDASATTFADKLTWDYDWTRGDSITVADFYETEDRSVLRRTFENEGTKERKTYDDEYLRAEREGDTTLLTELRRTGWRQVSKRRIKRQRVRRWELSGSEVLEDHGYVPGTAIPIVPLFGRRWYVDGIERFAGLTLEAIDAQRVFNMVVSSMTEAAGASPFSRPIFAPEQVQGLEDTWARQNIDRAPYGLARPLLADDGTTILQAGASMTVEPPQVAPNVAALLELTSSIIAKLLGEADQPQTVPANTSAQAIELVQDRGDARDYVYMDAMRVAMERSGEIWLGQARDLYVEEGREMVAVDGEGSQSKVVIGQEAIASDGSAIVLNDLSSGSYQVVVDVGPASKTRRDATVKALFGIAAGYKDAGNMDTANALYGVAVLNMDGEGLDGVKRTLRQNLLPGGWVEPTQEEAAQMAQAAENPAPDPNLLIAQAQMAVAEAERENAMTKRIEAETRRIAAEANAEAARAKAAAALAGIDRDDRAQVLAEVEAATREDRADRQDERDATMGAVDASMRVESHERGMTEGGDGDAA